MERLHKFLRLSSTDRALLVKAVLLVGAVRVGLWLLPFRTWRRLLAKLTRASSACQEGGRVPIDRVAWAVTGASRYVPAATCLTQALATKVLLCRNGHPASLHIGVARNEGGGFQAHAWVESDGTVVIGGSGSQLERYTPLPAVGEKII